MEQILNLQHISYTYHTLEGETPALSDISFSLNKGEFAAIDCDLSVTARQKTADQRKQRGFSTAGRSHDGGKFPFVQRK